MPTPEPLILAKATALGATLPRYRMVDLPEHFVGWAERIAQADSLRHAGKPYADAVAEADAYLGIRKTRLAIGVLPALVPAVVTAIEGDDLWLGRIAAVLGLDAPAQVTA